MRRRLLGASLTAAFAISALAAPTFADPPDDPGAPPNGHNCVGAFTSSSASGQRYFVHNVAKGSPGAWADYLHATLKPGCKLP